MQKGNKLHKFLHYYQEVEDGSCPLFEDQRPPGGWDVASELSLKDFAYFERQRRCLAGGMSCGNKSIWTKSTGCVQGIEEDKLAGTQSTCKGSVRETWESWMRHGELAVLCRGGVSGASFTGD